MLTHSTCIVLLCYEFFIILLRQSSPLFCLNALGYLKFWKTVTAIFLPQIARIRRNGIRIQQLFVRSKSRLNKIPNLILVQISSPEGSVRLFPVVFLGNSLTILPREACAVAWCLPVSPSQAAVLLKRRVD